MGPVLLLLLGSDLHMMERLTAYDRPFFGRSCGSCCATVTRCLRNASSRRRPLKAASGRQGGTAVINDPSR
jgi:hypothetical protein